MATTERRRATPHRWVFPNGSLDVSHVDAYARSLRVSPLVARLLLRRGFDTSISADAFLARKLTQMHDPALLPDIEPAVKRIQLAVDRGEKIVLFGDYDADGITATALLGRFLVTLKRFVRGTFEVECRVPQRAHGYGLSSDAVKGILDRKPKLLITLDNGVSSHDALDEFAAAGVDCIVVDHHHVAETLPKAVAVVNPKRKDSRYPFSELCGAGIAFKLAWALAVAFSKSTKVAPELREFLLDALAYAAIGTIADVVPLVDENRILAHQGLVALSRTQALGLKALIQHAAIEGSPKASDVSFRIAPRLNAAGRCGEVDEALTLLMTDDAGVAQELAAKLEQYNSERQGIEQRILEEARGQALQAMAKNPCALVLASGDWHQGVIGIVASRIVEEFYRPTMMLALDKTLGTARGSGRSIHGLHLAEALASAATHLKTHGGHAMAAGCSLANEHVEAFREALAAHASTRLSGELLQPSLRVDDSISLRELSPAVCDELDALEPFGSGNPRPLFAAEGVALVGKPSLMGRDESHVTFFARQEKTSIRCVGFHWADRFNKLVDVAGAGAFQLAFRPNINDFRGQRNVELVLEAFR